MKYCRKCGAQVEEDDIFCGYCGARLNEDESSDKRDFREEGGADFSDDLRDDSGESFGQQFDNEGANDASSVNHDRPVDEFETYFEDVNNNTQSTYGSDDSIHIERKPLRPNKLAKDAKTYGILALIFGFLGGILGIVFGIIGLQKAKKALQLCESGEYDGRPNAKDAKMLSIVGIVLGALALIIYII